jgi:DNA-binding NarL/FixJ family response regulator
VVILSGDDSFAMAHEAAMAGAHGYLVKQRSLTLPELLRRVLEAHASRPSPERSLPPAAEAYLRSRGLGDDDIALVRELVAEPGSEKSVAARMDRGHSWVRKRIELIRKGFGAPTQLDLGRILGLLSCFARIPDR